MPMTIEHKISLFHKQAELSSKYLEKALSERDYQHYAFLIGLIFEEDLM